MVFTRSVLNLVCTLQHASLKQWWSSNACSASSVVFSLCGLCTLNLPVNYIYPYISICQQQLVALETNCCSSVMKLFYILTVHKKAFMNMFVQYSFCTNICLTELQTNV